MSLDSLRHLPVKRKLMLIILTACSIILLLACSVLFAFQLVLFKETSARHLAVLAQVVADNAIGPVSLGDKKVAEEILSSLTSQPDIVSARIVQATGRELAAAGPGVDEDRSAPHGWTEEVRYEGQHMFLAQRITLKGDTLGTLYLHSNIREMQRELQLRYAVMLGLVLGGSFVIALILSARLQRFITVPILKLAETARVVAERRDYSVRAEKLGDDEFGLFTDTFNQMLVRIESQDGALRDSEGRYRQLVRSLPGAIYTCDAQGRITLYNEAAAALWGREPELGKDLWCGSWRAYSPDGRPVPLDQCPMAMAVRDGRSIRGQEVVIERPDGTRAFVLPHPDPIRDASGAVVGAVNMLVDLTERRRAEERLQASLNELAEFKLALDQHTIVAVTDPQGRINYANEKFCQISKYSHEELLGQDHRILNSGYHSKEFMRDLWTTIAQGKVWHGELRNQAKDGTIYWVDSTIVPFLNADGKPWQYIAIRTDITERKQAEEELRDSELKFRQLAENVREVFWMATPDMREIIYASPAYQEVWGRSVEELYKNPQQWVEAIAPEDRQRAVDACHALASRRPSYDIDYRIRRPDGTTRWIRDRGFQVLDASGKVYRTAGVASDITERKQAEESLETMHKQLVDASRHAGMAEVATGVLHNVGNVLNSVNVTATLVTDRIKKSPVANLARVVALLREHATDLGAYLTADPKGRKLPEFLGHLADHLAAEQSDHLKELQSLREHIDHIKDIVAMQQSYAKLAGVTETVNVTELVEDALRLNTGALQRHDVAVVREYSQTPPIITEKHKVLQILVNFIRNAKYACDETGRKDKKLIMGVSNGNGTVKISVTDNGVGIPAENLKRIFNHGFTTRRDGHGFGLHSGALAANELGGSLHVHSDGRGTGATFTLELPCQPTVSP